MSVEFTMTASHLNQEGIVRKAMKWAAKLSLALAVVAAVGLNGSIAQAIPLSTLVANAGTAGGTITVGDKIFSDFSFTLNTAIGNVNGSDPAGINVTPIIIAGNNGLEFGGLFSASAPPAPNAVLDVLIRYTVSTVSGLPLISDIHLGFN